MTTCANGHRNPRGHAFCGMCGLTLHPSSTSSELAGDASGSVRRSTAAAADPWADEPSDPGRPSASSTVVDPSPETDDAEAGSDPTEETTGSWPAHPVLFDDDLDGPPLDHVVAAHTVDHAAVPNRSGPPRSDPSRSGTPHAGIARPERQWWQRSYVGFTIGLWILMAALLVFGLWDRGNQEDEDPVDGGSPAAVVDLAAST